MAIRASDELIRRYGKGTGSIAIVLDCSGSMRFDGDGKLDANLSKWSYAKKALYQVLKESVPPGTNLSLWTFSQLPPDIGVDQTGHILPQFFGDERIAKLDAVPEGTITQLRSMSAWDPAQADEVKENLEKLNPYYSTPLIEAMGRAAKTDLTKAPGLKNLLVLTDGNDNRFKGDISRSLEQSFRDKGIRVTVVYFRSSGLNEQEKKIEEQDVAKAKLNFEKPLERLEPPGRFVEARNLGELTARLRSGLDQRLVCQVIRFDKNPAGDPIEVTRPKGDMLRWWSAGLDAGYYTLRVLADRTYEQEVNLQSGDRLIVDLDAVNGGGIAFRRALYGDDERFQDEEKQQGGPWRLTILGNRKTGDQAAGLALMAAIESTRATGTTLEQLRPGWVDFRITGAGLKELPPAFALRWRERLTYPATVWKLDVPRWLIDPADSGSLARPIVTAWWLAKADVAPDAVDLDPARVPFDVPLTGGRHVRVEEFAWEEHYFEVRPGEPPQLQHCLVIRLAYPMGSPYFVDPDSLKVSQTSYEHRYYTRAGKYAGLFGPVNESQFNTLRGSKFRLFSLNRLREEAAKRQQKVEIKLGMPSDDVRLPEPPRAIRK